MRCAVARTSKVVKGAPSRCGNGILSSLRTTRFCRTTLLTWKKRIPWPWFSNIRSVISATNRSLNRRRATPSFARFGLALRLFADFKPWTPPMTRSSTHSFGMRMANGFSIFDDRSQFSAHFRQIHRLFGLGLHPEDIGLHSLRASAAMAMYLNGIPVYTIMLLGRWSSDAFLRYIRKQVTEFSNGVSRKMIQNPRFHHMPDPDRNDPRTRHNSFSFTANMGMGNSVPVNRSAFSVWT